MPTAGAYRPDAGAFGPSSVEQAYASKPMPYYMIPMLQAEARMRQEASLPAYFEQLAAARGLASQELASDERGKLIEHSKDVSNIVGPVAMLDMFSNGAGSANQNVAAMDFATRKQPQALAQGAAEINKTNAEAANNWAQSGMRYDLIPQAETMAGITNQQEMTPPNVQAALANRRTGASTTFDPSTGITDTMYHYGMFPGAQKMQNLSQTMTNAQPLSAADPGVAAITSDVQKRQLRSSGSFFMSGDGKPAVRVKDQRNMDYIATYDPQTKTVTYTPIGIAAPAAGEEGQQ